MTSSYKTKQRLSAHAFTCIIYSWMNVAKPCFTCLNHYANKSIIFTVLQVWFFRNWDKRGLEPIIGNLSRIVCFVEKMGKIHHIHQFPILNVYIVETGTFTIFVFIIAFLTLASRIFSHLLLMWNRIVLAYITEKKTSITFPLVFYLVPAQKYFSLSIFE